MSKVATKNKTIEEGVPGFDWSMYDDGWNGKSLKRNAKVNIRKSDSNMTIYSHEKYASATFRKYMGIEPVSKEIKKGDVLEITDLRPLSDDKVMATVKNGANNIIIDLTKENKFINNLTLGNEAMDKETFVKCLDVPNVKNEILKMGITAKVGKDTEKASIWDGFVTSLNAEMIRQIEKPTRAYLAKVLFVENEAGLIVEISNAIRAFLPASLIHLPHTENKPLEYYVDKYIEVMVEDHRKYRGFIVSRKKYLNTILPMRLNAMIETLENDPNHVYTGTITHAEPYGVFVQLDECVTGMLHKSLVNDDLREQMREGSVEIGKQVEVYVHKVENNRVVFSNVATELRDEVMAKREAEDEAEKAAYAEELAAKEAAAEAARVEAEKAELEALASTFTSMTSTTIEL